MTGRHRAAGPSHRAPGPSARRLGTAAVGALGATTILFPLAPAIASADVADTTAPEANAPVRMSRPQVTHGRNHSHGARVVHAAAKEWGHPYAYGASGPAAFDCSGLTKYVYNKFGVNLPHNAAAQYQVVDHVSKANMRLGDLVFFYDHSGIYHVGIYAGGNKMWAASHTLDYVKKQPIYTDNFVVGRPG